MEVIYIMPKKVPKSNGSSFVDTYKSNKIKLGVNELTVNDNKQYVSLVNTR